MRLTPERTGSPQIRITPKERFWSKVDKGGDCWLWKTALNRSGYGVFSLDSKWVAAHRVSYEWSYGPIPVGMMVDHSCHVRHCVNPSHLRLATPKQNAENRKGATRKSKSGVRGVRWHKASGKWVGQVGHNGKVHHVGVFDTVEAASYAVSIKRQELFTPV